MARTGSAFREWLAHPSTIIAIVLVVLGLVFVSLEAQSQNWVYYTGDRVTGTVEGGIVYYKVAGTQYTQDDPQLPQPADGTRVGVYYQPGDPSAALLDRPVRWVELAGMLAWFVGGGLLLLVAALRRAGDRRRHREALAEGEHWWPSRAERTP